jgi:ABC-type branched-subunit amino acid transport system substrate-binding protein
MLCEYQACKVVQLALDQKYQANKQTLKSIIVPIATPSYSPFIAQAQNYKADFVLAAEGSQGVAGIVQAADQANYQTAFGLTFSCYDQRALALLPNTNNTVYCPSPFKTWQEAGDQMKAVMDKYGPSKWTFNYEGVDAWIASHMLVQALKTITGPITRQSILDAMHHMSDFRSEFLPVSLDFTKPGPLPDAPNVVNYNWYVYQVKAGVLTSVTPKPVFVAPIETPETS